MTRMPSLGFANPHGRVQRQTASFNGRRLCKVSDYKVYEHLQLRVRHTRMLANTERQRDQFDKLSADRNPNAGAMGDSDRNTPDFPLSAEALALFQEQSKQPVFDPTQVAGELGSTLSRLQNAKTAEFVTSSHLSPTVKGRDSNVGTALDILAEGHQRYIDYARQTIKQTFPGITEAGGKLYPEMRSKACWRDLQSFTRVVGYTVASDGVGISERGMDTLAKVYKELNVPLDAVLVGVDAVRRVAVQDAATAQSGGHNQQGGKTSTGAQPNTIDTTASASGLLDQTFRLLLSHLKGFRDRMGQVSLDNLV